MALDSLSGFLQVQAQWTAQKNITGSDYNPIQNQNQITKKLTQGTSVANASLGGANELISFVQSIGTSASVSIDLNSLTNIVGATGISLARVKGILIRLLNVADDAVVGTAASGITIDGTVASGLLSVSGSGWLTNITSKIDIPSGGFLAFGTGLAAGVACAAGANVLKLTNIDAAVIAKVQVTIFGGTT